jgi:hypothetical protein
MSTTIAVGSRVSFMLDDVSFGEVLEVGDDGICEVECDDGCVYIISCLSLSTDIGFL